MKNKDDEIFNLEQKIKELLPLIEKAKNIDNMYIEINEKNQTINFLLSQIEELKNNFNIKSQNFDDEINKLRNEKNVLEQNLEDNGKKLEEYQSKMNDIQSENNILIRDLNKKEEEYSKLLEEKIEIENNCNVQFEEQEKKFKEIQNNVESLNKENEDLKNKLADCIDISTNQFKTLNDSVIKSSVKMESLMNVYNEHINILKQRFENILNDLNIIVSMQGNNPGILNEKFDKIIKSINANIDLINKYSESESLIKNFKSEVKSLKANLESAKNKIKTLEEENNELNKTLNIQKLRMKIKQLDENKIDIAYDKLVNKMKDYLSITQLNIQNSNLFSENEKQKAQIKYLTENNLILNERHSNLEKLVNDLKSEIENKSNTMNKDNKYHKGQIKILMDQLTRIKETWTPYEKKLEYINHIEDLEKTIKELKNEINRKKDMIINLKNQKEEMQQKILKNESDTNSESNSSMSINTNIISSNNKEIQNLKSENLKKIKEIKELKKSLEKLNIDKQNLIEKNKVNKIDINRKDEIINNLKVKINNLKNDNDKLNVSTNDEQQKLLEELNKKEKAISTMKKNLDNLKKELQIYQEEKNINNENKKKSKEITSKEVEEKQIIINRMSACLRLILKDLSKKYETEKNKINLRGMNNTVKEEMMKLGLDEENVGDFIGKDENINKTSEQIDILLNDIKKFNTEKAFKLYNNLFESIKELESENIKKGEISFDNFKRSGISNNIFASSGGTDNNFLSKRSGINNFVRDKNNNNNNKILIESNS
jgi:chromosome segregation ATPase